MTKRAILTTKHLYIAVVVAGTVVFGGVICPPNGAQDPDAMTPLAKGEFERIDEGCDTGFVTDVIELLAGALGGLADIDKSCATYRREISTGVTLGEAQVGIGETPHWSELGGRGRLMADAGMCLLADLANAPAQKVTAQSPAIPTVFGPVSVTQTIGYLDWNPATKEFQGYQNIAVCAPVIGCLDATRQSFHAVVRETDPANPTGTFAGDYPIEAAYSIEFEIEESAFSFEAELPPITIWTPYGPVDVQPKLNYGTELKTIDTPFDGKPEAAHPMFADWIWTELDDLYGRFSPVNAIHIQSGLDLLNIGWSSQLGLGGRDGQPDAAIWTPNLADQPAPHRWDLVLADPRSNGERDAVVTFGAGAEIKYAPLEKLPPQLRDFVTEFSISVEPRLDAYYASQIEILSREAKRPPLDSGDSGTNRAEFHLANGVTASAEVTLKVKVRLLIEVPTPFGPVEIVNINKTVPAPLISGEPQSDFPRPAVARAGGFKPSQLDYVETLRTSDIDEADFLTDCLAYDPPPAPEPEPMLTPGESEDIDPHLYPCNLCVHVTAVSNEYADIPEQHLRLFEFGDPTWECTDETDGCFDLCRVDPATGVFIAIENSAAELGYFPCYIEPPH